MKKQRFFVIKGGMYNSDKIYFQDLDGAMKMFKFLMEGNAVKIVPESVPEVKKPDKDGYVPDESLFYIGGEPEYHLASEIKEIYTEKEIKKIKEEREAKIEILRQEKKK